MRRRVARAPSQKHYSFLITRGSSRVSRRRHLSARDARPVCWIYVRRAFCATHERVGWPARPRAPSPRRAHVRARGGGAARARAGSRGGAGSERAPAGCWDARSIRAGGSRSAIPRRIDRGVRSDSPMSFGSPSGAMPKAYAHAPASSMFAEQDGAAAGRGAAAPGVLKVRSAPLEAPREPHPPPRRSSRRIDRRPTGPRPRSSGAARGDSPASNPPASNRDPSLAERSTFPPLTPPRTPPLRTPPRPPPRSFPRTSRAATSRARAW